MNVKPRLNRTFDPSRRDHRSRRWKIELFEAMADCDMAKLDLVLGTIAKNSSLIDTQFERGSGPGAPLDYGGYGVYDERTSLVSDAPLFPHIVLGDTALHVALRNKIPQVASALIHQAQASLTIENQDQESPVSMLWRLSLETNAAEESQDFKSLVESLEFELGEYHDAMRTSCRDELTRLYEQYHPSRVAKIESQMTQYFGREHELMALVQHKYEPTNVKS